MTEPATDPATHTIGRPSTSEGIAAAIRARILDATLGAGQRLTEMDCAAEYDVGRGRVREAFRILVGEGYLEFLANRGVRVRHYSRTEILDMGRAREVIEGLAARLAAERPLVTGDRDRLSALQSRMDEAEAGKDHQAYAELNRAYHGLIAALAQNAYVADVLERVRIPAVRLQLPDSFAADALTSSNADHRVVTAAILNANGDAAEAAMRAHIRAGNAHIAGLPADVLSD